MTSLQTASSHENIACGIALRIAAAGLYSIMAALLKWSAERGVSAPEMLFYRALFGLPAVLIWVVFSQGVGALATRRPLAHAGRCLLGIASILCTFQALVMLPLADATTISFMVPVFATVLSWLVLREYVGPHRWFAVFLGFSGVIIVMRPGGSGLEVSTEGVAVALVAAFGSAGVAVTLRGMRHTEHVAAIVFWFFVASVCVGAALLPFFGHIHDGSTLLILAAAGMAGGLMQLTVTASFRWAPIAVLSPFDYLQIVGALVLGWLLLSSVPTLNTLAGAVLIACSGLYIAWRERRTQTPARR